MENLTMHFRSTKSYTAKAVCLSAVLAFFVSSSVFADISCTGPGDKSLSLQLVGQGAGTGMPIYKVTDPDLTENDRKAIKCTKNGSTLSMKQPYGGSRSWELWYGDERVATFTFEPMANE